METRIALEGLLDAMPHYEVDRDNCTRVSMQNVIAIEHSSTALPRRDHY